MAEEAWEGLFKGRTVLEEGVILPEELVFHDQHIEFDCSLYDEPLFDIIGYCRAYIEFQVPCGSYVTTAIHASPWVEKTANTVSIEPIDTTVNYVKARYSANDDSWTGEWHFHPENFCANEHNPYAALKEFSVYFTLHRYIAAQGLSSIYQLLL